MKLISLELRNFKSIKSFVLKADGEDKNIYGRNGVGKTTLADAYYWLLTDKSSLDKKMDGDIKSADPVTGNPMIDGGVEHSVEGVLDIEGRRVTLKKVYKEKWTKQNGRADKEFAGHTTDYSIDGVPKSKKDFASYICENIADTEVLKTVSSTVFFNNMAWKKQREILLDVCGDISDSDVIASDERLAQFPIILQGKSVNDFIAAAQERKRKINSELDKIPVRIDEAALRLEETEKGICREVLENEIKDLRRQQDRARGMIAAIQNGSEINNIKNRISETKIKITQLISRYELSGREKKLEADRKKNDVNANIESLSFEIDGWRRVISDNKAKKQEIADELSALRVKYADIFKSVFDESCALCPTCGQVLPQDKIDEAIENFNAKRADSLKKINQRGKILTVKSKEIDGKNDEFLKRIGLYKTKIAELDSERISLDEKTAALDNAGAADYTDDAEYKRLQSELNILKRELQELQNSSTSKISSLNSTAVQLDLDINLRMEKLALIAQAEKLKKRIDELKSQHKKLGAEFETLEQHLSIAQLFITGKVRMLTDKINGKFKIARFKLFEQQINGGITECCEAITADGAAYNSSMSNGERVKIGLDICAALAKHYGINLPIFIDNAESVTDMQDIDSQKILLIVSHHGELTVREGHKH